jgi:hypothetical protein
MNRLGSQYYDALNKVKEQFQNTIVLKCSKCNIPMEKDEDLGNSIVCYCLKCGEVKFVKKEK